MTDLSYQTIFERTFLLEKLPENINRSDEHLQYFDNYIENSRLCLRTIRSPQNKHWTWVLEQKFPDHEGDLSVWNVSRIYLNETEHQVFEQFEGREVTKNERVETNEIRFNRYSYTYQNKVVELDVFLGKEIWGLILGRIKFETFAEMREFEMPVFATLEVTQNKFFVGENLIGKSFTEVRAEFSKTIKSSDFTG